MSEGKDPAIKLFGKTIQLPDGACSQEVLSGDGGGGEDAACVKSEDRSSSSSSSSEVGEERESDDNNNKDLPEENKDTNIAQSTNSEENTDPNPTTSMLTDNNSNTKTPSHENESPTAKPSKSEEEQSDTSNNQEKTLKKPDKILPCPRCNSMDTKFCYYNNYNVNQPRHFCKNCQRYWTAGGTMRNVPVGAGRRKNKTSASQYRQITVTDSSLPIELNHHTTVLNNPNATVLTFGSDTNNSNINTPLCESMASVLKIADKSLIHNHKPSELIIPVHNDDKNINRPSVNDMQSLHGFSPQIPCFPPGAPWPYPWGPPAFCPPGYPMPFYPTGPYWGCPVPVPVPGPYWVPPPGSYHSAPPTSGPVSPLGKHSREESVKCGESEEKECESEKSEKSLWVPKTLRIDDPDEAAKSSIWATLGIKKDGGVGVNRGGIFKAFESKNDEKKMMQEISISTSTSPALQANPAALSRSINFQESS